MASLPGRRALRPLSVFSVAAIFSDVENADWRLAPFPLMCRATIRPGRRRYSITYMRPMSAPGLFRERRAYRIMFLANDTATPFIAGNQPVVNMLDPHATTNLNSMAAVPKLAMLLTKNTMQFPDRTRLITAFEAERYNYRDLQQIRRPSRFQRRGVSRGLDCARKNSAGGLNCLSPGRRDKNFVNRSQWHHLR